MRYIISLIITLTIIGIIVATGGELYLLYSENQDLKEYTKIQKKDIEKLTYQNELLQYKIKKQKKRYISRKTEKRKIIIENKNQYKERKLYNSYKKKTTHYSHKKILKEYPRYNGYIKLVSDSEIKQRKDNRFISNSPIYGIYKYRLFYTECGKNPKIYNVENECDAYAPGTLDKIYFSKININELKFFNPRDHMIECLYNQDYGIMQNCRAKLFQ